MNFLVFCVDQMQSFSLGCNGNKIVKTPHIDKLASRGCSYLRAYCNNPICAPSRATMLTGLTPRQHGCLMNGHKLPENIPTVTETLRRHGYRTHAIGKLHLQPVEPIYENGTRVFSWEDRKRWNSGIINKIPEGYYGFDTTDLQTGSVPNCYGDYVNWLEAEHPGSKKKYFQENAGPGIDPVWECWRMSLPGELHYNHWIADRTIARLDRLGKDDNFFIWCSFPDPHHPFATCRPYSEMYDKQKVDINPTWDRAEDFNAYLAERRAFHKDMTGFDENTLREIVSQTYGMITHVDFNIGRVLDHLEKKGLAADTAIIFMSDHGEYLGSHNLIKKGEWPWEELIRVPFIWNIPGNGNSGARCLDPVSLLDFVPTILDLAGIDAQEMDPRSLKLPEAQGLPGRSLKNNLESAVPLEQKPAIVEFDLYGSPETSYQMCRMRTIVEKKHKLTVYPLEGTGILTDLEQDPNEMVNLWDNPKYGEVKAELTEKLLFELVKTDRLEKRIGWI